MSFKVVIDSCGELTDEMKASGCFETASLMIQVDDHTIVDDATFDQADFLRRVAASPNCPKSSCPSPEAYRAAFDCDADHVFAVTLSSKLSGSYNSAVLGMNLLKEEKPDAKVYIFDSRSASIGETLIGLKIQECEEQGLPFEEIIDKVEAYIDSQMTWFVLENLETLRKNGRLSKVKAFMATALRIKPVMVSTPEGEIAQLEIYLARNTYYLTPEDLVRMVDSIVEKVVNPDETVIAISHCNCPERAQMLKETLINRIHPKGIFVVDTAGISSMYANDGGIIVVA